MTNNGEKSDGYTDLRQNIVSRRRSKYKKPIPDPTASASMTDWETVRINLIKV